MVVSKLAKTKPNSKYLIGYLDEAIKPLVLIMRKMGRYVKTFEFKDGNKDKNKKMLPVHIDDEKLLN